MLKVKNLNICIDIDGTITDPYFWLNIANKYFNKNITIDKVNTAKELKCDIFIEDSYANAMQLSENGFKVLLIDTNYNRKPLNKNIIRVFNWKEIYEIVKEIPLHRKAI